MKIAEAKKLWVLLEKAIADLRACEGSCLIDMNVWYVRGFEECFVCMAGAMLVADGHQRRGHLNPGYFEYEERKALHAVDSLRIGMVSNAVFDFYNVERIDIVETMPVPEYPDPGFYPALEEIRNYLKELDL